MIGAHSFYVDVGSRGGGGVRAGGGASHPPVTRLLVPADHPAASADTTSDPLASAGSSAAPQAATGDAAQALFIGRDGVVRADPR